ncbi:MAG: glycosyltransferase [Xanthomonadales bacterium]|nr:glycosyltransferase [Xanthomonadales bacterium]
MDSTGGIRSIAIGKLKRPRLLAACLESLAGQRYPKEQFEVIVVDDGGGVDLGPIIEPMHELLPG